VPPNGGTLKLLGGFRSKLATKLAQEIYNKLVDLIGTDIVNCPQLMRNR
jgi:hypothetical protein